MRRRKLAITTLAVVAALQLVAGLVGAAVVAGGQEECDTGAKAVLECISPSLAFVETPLATGSGVLIEGGYVVTNAHVVDPYGSADVTIAGELVEDVPVKGADLLADVALLGPLDLTAPAAALDGEAAVDKGDDVYLVGFPGEVDDEPEATVSRGVLSRVREAKRFGLTFFQTDAAIGGGQSGGALVDERGRVIGLSGLSFAEEFALALSAPDVASSAQRIVAGQTAPYRPFPVSGGATSVTVGFTEPLESRLLAIPPAAEDRSVRITVPANAPLGVEAGDPAGDAFLVNQEALEFYAALEGVGPEELEPAEVDEPVAPGTYEFDIPADVLGVVLLSSQEPQQVPFTSTTPMHLIADDDNNRPIKTGERVAGEIDSLEMVDTYRLDLNAGDKVEIFVGSPHGDMAYLAVAPGETLADAAIVDDSDAGLYGLDAEEELTAEKSGTYVIHVVTNEVIAIGYVIEFSRV